MGRLRPTTISARLVVTFLLVLGSAGCSSKAETAEERSAMRELVINGNDDRRELYELAGDEARARLAASVAALMWADRIEPTDPSSLRAPSLREASGVCPDERFAGQPAAAFCSATLIDDDLVLTAGHCLGSNPEEVQRTCGELVVVFDYHYVAEGKLALHDSEAVYTCREVAHYEHRNVDATFHDFAVLKLDRRVARDRQPVTVAGDPPRAGQAVVAASHGAGLPLKVDLGGSVVDVPPDAEHFVASTDSFAGGSGGPLFDESLELLGYQVRGLSDWSSAGDCSRATHADVPNEQHQLVGSAIRALCNSGWPSERLCGREPECGDDLCSDRATEDGCAEDCSRRTQDEPIPVNAGCAIARRSAGSHPFTGLQQLLFGGAALGVRRRRSGRHIQRKTYREERYE